MVEYRNAAFFSLEDLSTAFTRCFEGYVIPVAMTLEVLAGMMRVDAIDLAKTLVAVEGGEIIGMLMVCRRGKTMRIGAMAVAVSHRNQGLGGELMAQGLSQARERGETKVVLEVIESNTKAREFYERNGFKVVHRLISGATTLKSGASAGKVKEIGFDEMAARPFFRTKDSAAWQMSAASVSQMALPVVAYDFDGFAAAVVPRGTDKLLCFSLAPSGEDDAAKFQGLLDGLGARYPDTNFLALPTFPEPTFQTLFEAASLASMGISQFLMEQKFS